jgi:MraZ protein
MTPFTGTHSGKLDSKGRIAIPAPLRHVMEKNGCTDLAFRPSHDLPCIEAHLETAFNAMVEAINAMPQFSPERRIRENTIIARSALIRVDADGRVLLPERMVKKARLEGPLTFLGKGTRFEIWAEDAAEAHLDGADEEMRENAYTLSLLPLPPTPQAVP